MTRRLALLLAAGSLTIAAVPIAAGAPGGPVASTACTSATIHHHHHHKCIARGQFCVHRYQRDYRRYGLSCSHRDRNGRYHLR